MDFNELDLTKLLVYGTTTPGEDPNTHIRDEMERGSTVNVSQLGFMTNGAGRYMLPSSFEIVQKFFEDEGSGAPSFALNQSYTFSETAAILGLPTGVSSRSFLLSNYHVDPFSDDYIERSYLFGRTVFELADSMTFSVDSDGKYWISNLEVRSDGDNFDFESDSGLAQLANIGLVAAFDPYGLIPEGDGSKDFAAVKFEFTGPGREYTFYESALFEADQAFFDAINVSDAIAGLALAPYAVGLSLNTGYLGSINADPLFNYFTPDGKKSVYGTNADDTIVSTESLSSSIIGPESGADPFGLRMVGGSGNDTITGGFNDDELWGGPDSDQLFGINGNDLLIFDGLDTVVNGGFGTDLAKFYDQRPGAELEWDARSSYFEAEAVLGGSNTNTFYASKTGGEIFAGGAGDDTFYVPWISDGDKPTVIWDGGGADEIRFSIDEYYNSWSEVSSGPFGGPSPFWSQFAWANQHEALGILIVDVPNLSEDNFHMFSTALLPEQYGAGFSEIDLVLLNPSSGLKVTHETPSSSVSTIPADGSIITIGTKVSSEGFTTIDEGSDSSGYERVVDTYSVELGGNIASVQSAGSDWADSYIDEDGEEVEQVNYTSSPDGWDGSTSDFALSPGGLPMFTSADAIGGVNSNWFIIGGSVSGTSFSSDGSVTLTLPDPASPTSLPKESTGGPSNESFNGSGSTGGVTQIVIAGDGRDVAVGGDEDDRLFGDGGSDNLVGNSGDDGLYGGGGADILVGGAGTNEAIGGDGDDTLVLDSARSAYSVSESAGTVTISHNSSSEAHTAITVEKFKFADQILTLSELITPSSPISGTTGNETITGGAGDDAIIGGTGVDTFDGGDGTDTLDFSATANSVEVYLKFDEVRAPDGDDTVVNVENLIGTASDDRLSGNEGDNVFQGGSGDDIINGKDGNDIFVGGQGDDKLTGGSGVDLMFGDDGGDTLFGLDETDTLYGGSGRDFLYGGKGDDIVSGGAGDDEVRGNLGNDVLLGDDGADDIRGGGANDALDGGEGNDFLFGENGKDILNGGAGNDAMSGGMGGGGGDGFADTFVYADSALGGGGYDRVKDFEDGIDQIDLTAFGFTDFVADVFALSVEEFGGVAIKFGGLDTLFIENYTLASFDATDVIL